MHSMVAILNLSVSQSLCHTTTDLKNIGLPKIEEGITMLHWVVHVILWNTTKTLSYQVTNYSTLWLVFGETGLKAVCISLVTIHTQCVLLQLAIGYLLPKTGLDPTKTITGRLFSQPKRSDLVVIIHFCGCAFLACQVALFTSYANGCGKGN